MLDENCRLVADLKMGLEKADVSIIVPRVMKAQWEKDAHCAGGFEERKMMQIRKMNQSVDAYQGQLPSSQLTLRD